ncbi:MAG TPA: GNAT family N-acetyltransferase [Mesorhizobium sp.]|jgi:ribosomal protein S18 acetylase RimI-like enzyme|nr:GNAT family N-acetyltransferase [Mesorhizobium sp.]
MRAEVRSGTPANDATVAEHYLAIWRSYGTSQEHFRDDALDVTLAFIRHARARLGLGTFLAFLDGEVAGSAACNLQIPTDPEVIRPEIRRHGYIWSVYVDPRFQHRGIGRALVNRAVGHLREIGCHKAVLHASDAGIRLYEQAGFSLATEMRLPLVEDASDG